MVFGYFAVEYEHFDELYNNEMINIADNLHKIMHSMERGGGKGQ